MSDFLKYGQVFQIMQTLGKNKSVSTFLQIPLHKC